MIHKACMLNSIFFKTLLLYFFFRFNSFSLIIRKLSNHKQKKNNSNISSLKRVVLIRLILKYFLLSKNCFHRAFISTIILKDSGINAQFVIGVSLDSSFKSHAWVECKGSPILESFELSKYKVIYRI
jgi:hypothetical protein